MKKTPSATPVNEFACAESIGMSVHFLRKDRIGKKRIPFIKINSAVRYDLATVHAALRAMQTGGGK